jgi:Skp family chaperone for outer membrane proteins
MPSNDELLAELRRTKGEIDQLQARLKELVAELQEAGMSTQDITAALKGE